MDRCKVEIPGAGQCEIQGKHDLDSRGWEVHRVGEVTWNGKRPSEIEIAVRDGAVITAVIGEVDGHFIIWHMKSGAVSPYVITAENPLVITVAAKV